MNRFASWTLCFAFLFSAAMEVRGDIVASTIDPIGVVAPAILRIDEQTGTNLSAATIPAGTGGLSFPTDIAVGPDGNIYTTDNNLAKVLYFDGKTGQPLVSPVAGEPDGVFSKRAAPYTPGFGAQSSTSLVFGQPSGSFAGDVFVVQQDLGVVEVYDGSAGILKGTLFDALDEELPEPTLLASSTFTPSGTLLVSDFQGSRIYQVDLSGGLDGEVVTEFAAAPGGVLQIGENFELFFPAGMASDSAGNVYVANLFGNNIVKFDSNGENPEIVLTIPGELTEPNYYNTNLPPSHFPSDVVVEDDDTLLLAILGQKNTLDNEGMPQQTEGRVLRVDLSQSTPQVETLIDNQLPVTSVALIADLLPGDYNGDGVVDLTDFEEWKSNFGETVSPGQGADGNRDGLVDIADYTVWRNTLGASGLTEELGALATSVPEPGTITIALVLGAALFTRGRFQRCTR